MECNVPGWGWDRMPISAEGDGIECLMPILADGIFVVLDGLGWKDGMIFHSINIPSGGIRPTEFAREAFA